PDFETGEYSKNEKAFRGFFVNIYGVRSDKYLKSGGNVSPEGLQTRDGVELPLRRSGAVAIETAGNFNKLGWILTPVDDEWWIADYRNDLPTDLYSIAMHEIGHSLLFNPGHPGFARFQKDGVDGSVDDALVVAYQGGKAYLHASSHLVGSVDRLSKKGAFGFGEAGTNQFKGIIMPPRRWLITKLDLLVAQAAGYKLRQTSAFVPLSHATSGLSDATVAVQYRQALQASGGIPSYYWAIETGNLPKGLALDSFTGEITGIPEEAGSFNFVARLRDGDDANPGVTLPASINVRNP
ncbi:MAG: putative Ig domain-containing protein, partial [Chloroflexi bacterium]|nr:putative Ig domain-containing protein [Chloroflexota bacterium]